VPCRLRFRVTDDGHVVTASGRVAAPEARRVLDRLLRDRMGGRFITLGTVRVIRAAAPRARRPAAREQAPPPDDLEERLQDLVREADERQLVLLNARAAAAAASVRKPTRPKPTSPVTAAATAAGHLREQMRRAALTLSRYESDLR
jgi:hypothetical protein